MNNYYTDIGYKSLRHYNEQLCGDHIDISKNDDNRIAIVLADGLGSGVKASILATLTSKIISTMATAGLSLDECISTIAATLPVCSERDIAYSTFSIIEILNNQTITLIQYDNPYIIMLRDNENYDYPKEKLEIEGKKIYKTNLKLQENDTFLMMSDGCPFAGSNNYYNYNWKLEDIADYFQTINYGGYNAKTLATMIIDECEKLYKYQPNDDATACIIKIRSHQTINLAFGPPNSKDDDILMMENFFAQEGKHIVCGGTTAQIVANYLNKPIVELDNLDNSNLPPISQIEGIDLVSEGIITINYVLEYAKDFLEENLAYQNWSLNHDGASIISRLLFEDATDINFFIGKAINPAHQSDNSPINFHIKMKLINELASCLKQMNKKVNIYYY